MTAPPVGPPGPSATSSSAESAAPPGPPRPRKHYNIDLKNVDVRSFTTALAKEEGVEIHSLGHLYQGVSLVMNNATFDEIMDALTRHFNHIYRIDAKGVYYVGAAGDVFLALASPTDTTEVQVFHHCRSVDPVDLASTLSRVFPALKIMPGPLFSSPALEFQGGSAAFGGGGMPQVGGYAGGFPGAMGGYGSMPSGSSGFSGGGAMGIVGGVPSGADSPRGFSSSDLALRREGVIIMGPANGVRKAMDLAEEMDRVRRQVKINLRMAEVTKTASRALGINWNVTPAGGTTTTIGEIPNSSLTGYTGNSGINFGSIGHSPLSFGLALDAQEQLGNVKTLANPSMMVLNGERCFIHLGDKYLYPKQNGVNAQGLPTYDVAELDTGVYLQIAVNIGDADDVLLSLYPQDSFVDGSQTYNGSAYPIVSTRQAQTTVRLKDGETMVIGGLRQTQDSKQEAKLPFLGSIPLLGRFLFNDKTTSKSDDDLVIMIQPEIMVYSGNGQYAFTTLETGETHAGGYNRN